MTSKKELQDFVSMLNLMDKESEESFPSLIKHAQRILELEDKDIRQLFGASQPTLVRWTTGESQPALPMRLAIQKTFRDIAVHILEEHNGEA